MEADDMDYADDIALLANVPAQAETLLHNLEGAAAGLHAKLNNKLQLPKND